MYTEEMQVNLGKETDDLTSVIVHYDWSPYKPASWYGPTEGGVEVFSILREDTGEEITDEEYEMVVETVVEYLEGLFEARAIAERLADIRFHELRDEGLI